jgi:hypothetical protein
MLTIRGEVTWQRDAETGEWKAIPVEKITGTHRRLNRKIR